MADEVASSTPVEAPAPAVDAPTESTEPAQTNGETKAPEDKKEETQADVEHAKIEESVVEEEKAQDAEPASSEPPADGTPGGSKDKKRKSVGGVPEHKSKKLNKKKSMPTLRLECKPGEFYWARLKGYPPWPAIICDESMLPESLLASRPVSTARPDGSLRADFEEGGKNAKERTFPIMFLHTNEFQWMVNTALTPLDPEECKTLPKTKMTKALQEAYKVASEGYDIEYFKKLLRVWQDEEEAIRKEQEEFAAEQERLAAEQAAKAEKEALEEDIKEKPKKKAARKSKGGDDDIDMEDAEAPKSTKKRKKDAESGDDDAPKAKKTPKVKLNAPKTPNGEASASKKSTTKPKKKVVTAPKQESEEEKPQMTEAERLAQREKAILYLRHRLQKGFLSRDQAPKEEEMEQMAEFFTQLESYDNLEPSIIRTTKIHKVLKAIVKLASVPKDDQFSFKKRSGALLEIWNKRMEAEGDAPKSAVDAPEEKEKSTAVEDKAPETNGAKEPEKEIAKDDQAEAKQDAEEGAAKPAEAQEVEMKDAEADEKPAETETEKKADEATGKIEAKIEEKVEEAKASDDKDGDVSMQATETA